MPDASAIQNALNLGPSAGPEERTIDITTFGAKSGEPRRLEIWFHQIDGRWYITGVPPRQRAWYLNMQANPHFTFHLKGEVKADLDASARPITEVEERREVLAKIIDSIPAGTLDPPPLEDWVQSSPLVEVTFDDLAA